MLNLFHVSDIHIRSGAYEDIEYAWARLIEYIAKCNRGPSGSAILCVAGDVFEHKTSFSPEDVSCFTRLIDATPAAIPIVLIPGNHDFSRGSQDMITPIQHAAKRRENIYYFPRSGVYPFTIAGTRLEFHVISPMDSVVPPVTAGPQLRVALVHEQIGDGRRLSLAKLRDYHLVLAGDDHCVKFLGDTVAYCGSLTQKNINEPIDHGLIHWRVDTKSAYEIRGEFVPLKQRRVALRLEMSENNEPEIPPGDFESVRRISLVHKRCDPDHVRRVVRSLRERFRCDIREVCASAYPARQDAPASVEEELAQFFSDAGADPARYLDWYRASGRTGETRYKWRLVSLSWDDFMCYGKGNRIDFSCLDGVNALLAPNGWGKSAFIDALCFALFGKTMRGTVAELKRRSAALDVTHARVSCTFFVHEGQGVEYTVSRVRGGGKELTDTLISGGVTIAAGARAVDAAVSAIVGSADQFLAVCVATQDRDFSADYAHLFETYLGLDTFAAIYKDTCKRIRENRAAIKHLEVPDAPPRELGATLAERESELSSLQSRAGRLQAALNAAYAEMGVLPSISPEDAARIMDIADAGEPLPPAPLDPAPLRRELEALRAAVPAEDTIVRLREELAASRLAKDAATVMCFSPSCESCAQNKRAISGTRPFAEVREELVRATECQKKIAALEQSLRACELQLRRKLVAKARVEALKERGAAFSARINELQSEIRELAIAEQTQRLQEAQRAKRAALEDENRELELYKKAMSPKTGVPARILERFCASIESSVNEVLRATTNFSVRINSDWEKGLNLSVVLENGTEVSTYTLSGSQKFITDWAVRLALIRNHAYMPNILIVDEGFGALDPTHLAAMKRFLTSLSSQNFYEWIIIISHIDELQTDDDITAISITRTPEGSHLCVEASTADPRPQAVAPTKTAAPETTARPGYTTCVCGSVVRTSGLAAHLRTQKHKRALK